MVRSSIAEQVGKVAAYSTSNYNSHKIGKNKPKNKKSILKRRE
jgi:hypothetical protein